MKELDIAIVREKQCKKCLYYFFTWCDHPDVAKEGHPVITHFCDRGIPGLESPHCKFIDGDEWMRRFKTRIPSKMGHSKPFKENFRGLVGHSRRPFFEGKQEKG